MERYFEVNRANWDERADIHAEDVTGAYAIERFLAGEDVLFPIEAAELGDIEGADALHLQCHIGVDTLCLARRGARAIGLDFSSAALDHARSIAERAGLAVRFVHGTVYEAPALLGESAFDLVYTTWGTITWLPDVRRWAEVIARVLRPGGRLYFADLHPMIATLEEIDGRLTPIFTWRTPASVPLSFQTAQTYTGDPREMDNPQTYEWNHPISDIVMALIDAGLVLTRMSEHEALPWQMFPMMVAGADRLWRLPPGAPHLPLSLTLEAVKPA